MRCSARFVVAAMLLILSAVPLMGQGFGRNKVQYREFDFYVLETEHFSVHYYPEEADAAFRAASMLERGYTRFSTILGHEFKDGVKKPVILYSVHSHFQQTNTLGGHISEGTGGVTEYMKKRLIMPIGPAHGEFEHVLLHELVHVFQYDIIEQSANDGFNPFKVDLPLWFIEGMAEYLSIGRLDARTHATMRDAVYAGYARDLFQMSMRSDYLSYRFGQSMWAYLGARYGDQITGHLLKQATRSGVANALRTILQYDSLELLSHEWMGYLRTQYYGQMLSRSTAAGQKIAGGEEGDVHTYLTPALSPDGEYIVYASSIGDDMYGFLDLWLATVDGKPVKRLVRTSRSADFESLRSMTSSPAWSFDGGRIAFVAKNGGRDALYIYDLDTEKTHRYMHPDEAIAALENPRFSPDGGYVVVTGVGYGKSDLFMVNLSTEAFVQLTDDPYADLHPAWSPDGSTIAFATDRSSDTDFDALTFAPLQIALYDVESGAVSMLPQQVGTSIDPVWSPDGGQLAYISDRTGVATIFLWDLRQRELRYVRENVTGVMGLTATSPALSWSAHSDALAYNYFQSGGFAIYLLEDPWNMAQIYTGEELSYEMPKPTPVYTRLPIEVDSADVKQDEETRSKAVEEMLKPPSITRLSASDSTELLIPEDAKNIGYFLERPTVGLPDTAAFSNDKYRSKLTLDRLCPPQFGVSTGGFRGTQFRASGCAAFSDLLGDRHAIASLNLPGGDFLSDSYVFLGYFNLRKRLDRGLTFSQYPYYRYLGAQMMSTDEGLVYRFALLRNTVRSLSLSGQYSLSPFQRHEGGIGIGMLDRDTIVEIVSAREARRDVYDIDTKMFGQASYAWVYDDALPGFVHSLHGTRVRLGASGFAGGWTMGQVSADARRYQRLGGRFSLAARVTGTTRFGKSAHNFVTYWGHPSIIRGFDWNTMRENACIGAAPGVECFDMRRLIGSNGLFGSLELRFPIFNPIDRPGIAFLPFLGGAAFVDAGVSGMSAQERDILFPNTGPLATKPVYSYGLELRMPFGQLALLRFGYVWTPQVPHRPSGWMFTVAPVF